MGQPPYAARAERITLTTGGGSVFQRRENCNAVRSWAQWSAFVKLQHFSLTLYSHYSVITADRNTNDAWLDHWLVEHVHSRPLVNLSCGTFGRPTSLQTVNQMCSSPFQKDRAKFGATQNGSKFDDLIRTTSLHRSHGCLQENITSQDDPSDASSHAGQRWRIKIDCIT